MRSPEDVHVLLDFLEKCGGEQSHIAMVKWVLSDSKTEHELELQKIADRHKSEIDEWRLKYEIQGDELKQARELATTSAAGKKTQSKLAL